MGPSRFRGTRFAIFNFYESAPLPELERPLHSATDLLWDKMDISEFNEYIFGTLSLKRASDMFTERYEEIVQKNLDRGRTKEEAK